MEIWKDIKGYEGKYQVSNFGRVKSVERFRVGNKGAKTLVPERIRIQSVKSNGYNEVTLWSNAKNINAKVHRLVAVAFIDNSDNKPTVNHKNGIKTDNRVENLEWATRSENSQHSWDNWMQRSVLLGKNGGLHPASIAVIKMDSNNNELRKYNSVIEASLDVGCSSTHICSCCKGKYETAKGYKWKYAT